MPLSHAALVLEETLRSIAWNLLEEEEDKKAKKAREGNRPTPKRRAA